ncbi:MAG TPA: hypothetical protein ENK91_10030 [Bacteroidetes bacterium]|nr:hypothetical protein [Bacteroidota bacterium]
MESDKLNELLGIAKSHDQSNNERNFSDYRYPTLRTIASAYMVLAWIIGIATIISIFYFFLEDGKQIFGLVSLIIGSLLVLVLATISESIKVFLDIEYNTRKASENKNSGNN